MNSKRRAGKLAIVACLLLIGSPPAFAQSQPPESTNLTLPPLTVSSEQPRSSPPAIVHTQPAPAPASQAPAIIHQETNGERPQWSWIGVDFLLWTSSGDHLPPLISASPPGTPRDQAGVLGTPGTVALFGNESVNDEWRPGVRLRAGCWLDDCATCGIEASVFFLDPADIGLTAGPPGIVGRPFINVNGQPDAQLVNLPGIISGSVTATAKSTVWGGDVNVLHCLACGPCFRIDLLAGYKFLELTDTVAINENLISTDPAGEFEPGTRLQIQDRFRTTNTFHGGALGLRGEHEFGLALFRYNASVALGNVHQASDIAGSTQIMPPGLPTVALPGGLLALQSNSGHFDRDNFAVMPALGVQFGYQLTCRLHAFAGYEFLYLSRVTRPGDVIDVTINPNQLPPPIPGGPARPAFLGGGSDYWLHGLTFGVEWRF